jgi:hypothetical protein
MLTYYPLIIALVGFGVAALVSERALSLMQADAKLALVAASASTRLLSILVAAVFIGLILWRPPVAWAFLGIAYIGLGVRSIPRVRRLNLPVSTARLLHSANLAACAGMVICAGIYELRALA